LVITNTATDPEAPPQILTYSLAGSPPYGASINGSNGIFFWRPAMAQSGTNLVAIRVSDNGTPNLSATQSFSVAVNRPSQPVLSSLVYTGGQFQLLISGDSGPDYRVQSSTNLADWVALFSTNSPLLPFRVTDPSGSNYSQRFYRAVLGP
jgi:hypothetical protein